MPRKKSSPVQPTVVVQQNNNVLYLILAVLVVALGYMFVRMMSLEKKLTAGGVIQAESPLTVDNLKKYAKDLGLNTGDFNKCLDGNAKKAAVDADVAYGTSVGIQGTPGFFVNGKFLAGAFPYEVFKEIIDRELAGTGSQNCADYSAELQPYCSDPANLNFNPVPQQLNVEGVQGQGPANAKIQLVEFSDFECPYCQNAYPTVKQILNDYKGQVRFYYMHYPLTQIHPQAQKAAEASLCAADQGKFWEYHDKMFESAIQASR